MQHSAARAELEPAAASASATAPRRRASAGRRD